MLDSADLPCTGPMGNVCSSRNQEAPYEPSEALSPPLVKQSSPRASGGLPSNLEVTSTAPQPQLTPHHVVTQDESRIWTQEPQLPEVGGATTLHSGEQQPVSASGTALPSQNPPSAPIESAEEVGRSDQYFEEARVSSLSAATAVYGATGVDEPVASNSTYQDWKVVQLPESGREVADPAIFAPLEQGLQMVDGAAETGAVPQTTAASQEQVANSPEAFDEVNTEQHSISGEPHRADYFTPSTTLAPGREPPKEAAPLAAPISEGAATTPELPMGYRARRRGSVSAEAASVAAGELAKPSNPRKSSRTEEVILRAMTHSFLFSDLEEEQKIECVASMFRKEVAAGELVIRQGEEGDNFYVIAEGDFSAHIVQADGQEKTVCHYEGKGAFGELALMYNCPRAASVQADTAGVLWAMDRMTFREIILASRIASRERFELALSQMSVFGSLTPVQRASIADCLVRETYEEGATILEEGEELGMESKFYIVEEGSVWCYRAVLGKPKLVKQIGSGGFFGEVALVTKSSTRAATCNAKTRCKLLAMGRDAFERLMGPAEEILKKEVDEYERMNTDLVRLAADGPLTGGAVSISPTEPGSAKTAPKTGGRTSAAGRGRGRKAQAAQSGRGGGAVRYSLV